MVRTLLILFLIAAPLAAEESFIFEYRENIRNQFLSAYPESRELFTRFDHILDTIAEQVSRRDYRGISSTVQEEIRLYDFDTGDPGELYLLICLIKIDAATDYYLLNDRRSGANKNYLMSFLFSQSEKNHRLKNVFKRFSVSTFLYDISIMKNYGYGLSSYDKAVYAIFSIFSALTPFFFTEGLADGEEEDMNLYYGIFEEDHPPDGPAVNIPLLYDYLTVDLFYMSDYKEDIRLYCSTDPEIREACIRAVNHSGGDIPLLDTPASWVQVLVTYRRAKAFEFFEQYY
jgi:hypothetical protein